MGRTAEAGKFMPQSGPEMNRLIIAAVAAYKTSDPSNRVPGEKDLEIVWAEIFLGAGAPFTTADLDAFEKIEVLPHPQVCDLMIALLRRVFTLKTEHRVLIIRWLLFEATKI